MNSMITLLIFAVIFAAVAVGIHWIAVKYGAPQPIVWIVGAILIIFLLIFLLQQLGLVPGAHRFGS